MQEMFFCKESCIKKQLNFKPNKKETSFSSLQQLYDYHLCIYMYKRAYSDCYCGSNDPGPGNYCTV